MEIKKSLLIIALVSPLFADLSISQMETMVERIKSKRKGNADSNISKVVSPFVMIQIDDDTEKVSIQEPEKESIVFSLGGIFDHKAFVNGKWLKIGDKISGYEMIEISGKSVKFVQGRHTIEVFLKKCRSI